MTLDDRLTRALQDVADGVAAPEVDLDALRSTARSNRVRALSVTAAAAATAVVALIVASTALLGGRDTSAPLPASNPPPSTATSTSSTSYTSSRYGFTIVHPPGWVRIPAVQDWTWEADARDFRSRAHEAFRSPDDDVSVSAWSVPLDPGPREESIPYLVAWAENYCERSVRSPCTGIADRAVELCLEPPDCHPGLLVPFTNDVQAFFSGGKYGSDAMTVVAVWRGESAPSVAPYGGARKLLETFLAPMDVRPTPTSPSPGD